MRAFRLVLENLPSLGVDADLEGLAAALDVERPAKAAAARFLLQLTVGDCAGPGLHRDGLRLLEPDLGLGRELVAGIGGWRGRSLRRSGAQGHGESRDEQDTLHEVSPIAPRRQTAAQDVRRRL